MLIQAVEIVCISVYQRLSVAETDSVVLVSCLYKTFPGCRGRQRLRVARYFPAGGVGGKAPNLPEALNHSPSMSSLRWARDDPGSHGVPHDPVKTETTL